MTDKEQRIVDGVDVSSCPACNLNCGIPQCSEFFKHFPSSIYCRDNPNCLFKQLARKTQECEELKKKLRDLELKNTTLQNRYQQLDGSMTELNRYRKALEEIEGIAKNFGSYAAWQEQRINKILDIISKAKGEE